MFKLILILVFCAFVNSTSIFHEGSKVTFSPDQPATYFGYTVVFSPEGLLVGAPKAKNRENPTLATGMVFNCPIGDSIANATCTPLVWKETIYEKRTKFLTFLTNDMWFGSTITPLAGERLLICGYRWLMMTKDNALCYGKCYLRAKYRNYSLSPLSDSNKLVYLSNGERQDYGKNLTYFFCAQAGMSVKAIGDDTVLLGAPGLLQWTGGIVEYRYGSNVNSSLFKRRTLNNPYFTRELEQDAYFGYSIDAGVFDDSGKTLFVGAAPRAKLGHGKVLIYEPRNGEQDPLNIHYVITGPQMGSYFGASLCCVDVNGDGTTDILVGAPNFVFLDGSRPYEQGAVFVYMTQRKLESFTLDEPHVVTGSKAYRARFGTTIADLGDLDGDGFNDIAIGAPWEDEGSGAVYIYRGSAAGLRRSYSQRLTAEGAGAFGISISKGFDADANKCNDFAVGAHNSGTVYLYHCVPTVHVKVDIRVPEAMNLPQNASGFTAYFCVSVPSRAKWPHVTLTLKAVISVDPEENRASINGDSEYTMTIKPGTDKCDEQEVNVKPTADLSKPISINFVVTETEPVNEQSQFFPRNAVRISEDSKLHASYLIQLLRDCGKDLICTPLLEMSLEPLESPYIPGASSKLGAILRVYNKEEPAYGAKVNITLPLPPKRVPGACSLYLLNLTCDVPAPLMRNEEFVLEIELEYTVNDSDKHNLIMVAELEDHLYNRNITKEFVKNISLAVEPRASFAINGKPEPNATLQISKDTISNGEKIAFSHYFEIKNLGPSDWFNLEVYISLPDKVNLSSPINGCVQTVSDIACEWSIPARVTQVVPIYFKFDLASNADILKENSTFNVTTVLTLPDVKKRFEVVTTLILEPVPPIWHIIVGSVVGFVAGFILLAVITSLMHRYGFFSRSHRERLKQLQEQVPLCEDVQGTSTGPPSEIDDSSRELLFEDTD